MSWSPMTLGTGQLSPVCGDSSNEAGAHSAVNSSPSTGMFSPSRTSSSSPSPTSSAKIDLPASGPDVRRAMDGARRTRSSREAAVLRFARALSSQPRSITVMSMQVVSKKCGGDWSDIVGLSPASTDATSMQNALMKRE